MATGLMPTDEGTAGAPWFEVATISDVGTERDHNEDHCGSVVSGEASALIVVADGVSSAEAGEVASHKAVETALRAFQEEPAGAATAKRLHRAVQQANIEIYDMAMIVPELRGMTTTVTAVALDRNELSAAHVGDSRLYVIRDGAITQLTKDHTVAAERVRMGLLNEKKARNHPDHSTLTRCVGRELIANIDRLTTRVYQGDTVIVCTDGLYNVLEDAEIHAIVSDGQRDAAAACRALIDAANERGTLDNLTAAVVRVGGPVVRPPERPGLGARIKRLLRGRPAADR